MTHTVGILVFDEIEVLDLGGPFEVLSVASRVAQRRGQAAPFVPLLLAQSLEPVTARGGLRVLPHATLTDHPTLDVLMVPGGKYVTSGGISAGIEMTLHLVERLHTPELAVATARQMEYRWKETPHA